MYKDDWDIQKRVEAHVKEVQETHKYDGVEMFVCAANGSMNYGLFDESSDVDTKMLVFPELDDLFLGRKSINKVEVLANNEHCTLKDIRDYFRIFRKANINFLEILCTDYVYVNPVYKNEWNLLCSKVDEIANLNPHKVLASSLGMAREKASKICHDSPANHELIEKHGYVAKELQHIIRLYNFIFKYCSGVPFSKAIRVNSHKVRDEMMDIKRYRISLTPEEAKARCDEYVHNMKAIIEDAESEKPSFTFGVPKENIAANDFLDNFLVNIMTKYTEREIANGSLSNY